jgi:hypothetical protein
VRPHRYPRGLRSRDLRTLTPSRIDPSGANRNRSGCAALLVALAVVAPEAARADEPPSFRHGLWEFDRTIGGQKLQTKSCSNPSEDMQRQNAILEKGGCKFPPGKRSGNAYTFTVDCAVRTPDSDPVTVRSASVITVESDSAYKVDITTTGAGTSMEEHLIARRVGDCAK